MKGGPARHAGGQAEQGQELGSGIGNVVGDRVHRLRAGGHGSDAQGQDHGEPVSAASGFAGVLVRGGPRHE